MPTCSECKRNVFENIDGCLVCVECHSVLPDQIETVYEYGLTQGRTNKASLKTGKLKPSEDDKNKQNQEWILYDGFNYILVKMTDALIKCGAPPKIKPCVHQLWASFLKKIGVAYCQLNITSKDHPDTSAAVENQEVSVIPDWFSQNPVGNETQDDAADDTSQKSFLFAPAKVPKKKRKKARSAIENLKDTPDADLTVLEVRKKRKQIRESFLKLALSGVDTDCETFTETEAMETAEEIPQVQQTRLSTMRETVPECFPENKTITSILKSKKTAEFTGPKSTLTDPEYMTLHKLLSFLHAALLMKGVLISYADLIRWVREGFIPLYGAHRLLPSTMPLSRADALILGGVSTSRSRGAPSSNLFRQNTARLLTMLDVTLLPKPPSFLLASKIVSDLQLPDDLVTCVETLDKLVSKRNGDKWKLVPFGNSIDNGTTYAAALLVIALKLILGLDGSSEYKISDFADKANDLLQLKASSGFSRRKKDQNKTNSSSTHRLKTLFVWREWVRFVEYRRLTLERTHVPTAIRKGVVNKMDPEYVLRFAKNEGYLHYHRTGRQTEIIPKEEQILKFLDQSSKRFSPSPSSVKRIPVFRPTLLATQGLAEQLLQFDRSEYSLLEQRFSDSSLSFAIDPKPLADALKRCNPPHNLKICLGPAYVDVNLTLPFISSRAKMSQMLNDMDRYGAKPIKIRPVIIPASVMFEEEEEEEEGDDASQPRPSLLLFQPSSGYWSRSLYAKAMTNNEWDLFSAELPSTFVWMLNLICDSIEEAPKDLYMTLSYLETIIFMRHTKLEHSLTTPKVLKHRLVSAMRKEL